MRWGVDTVSQRWFLRAKGWGGSAGLPPVPALLRQEPEPSWEQQRLKWS